MSDTIVTDLSSYSSEMGTRDGTDSGYVTGATNTPEHGSFKSSQQDFDLPLVELPISNFLRRKITKLRVFDKEIPIHVRDRFLDLNELHEKPLCDYLRKKNITASPISIKLKTLGENEDAIDFWYVVMCPDQAVKWVCNLSEDGGHPVISLPTLFFQAHNTDVTCIKVKQFFAQQHVKSEFHPLDRSLNQPYFKMWVCSRAPRMMAAGSLVEICEDISETIPTLCGRAIRVEDQIARIGGVIKVVTEDKGIMLYAMTAGHIFVEDTIDQEIEDQEISIGEDSDCDSLFEEDFELDSALGEDEDGLGAGGSGLDRVFDSNETKHFEETRTAGLSHGWAALGHKAVALKHSPEYKRNLD